MPMPGWPPSNHSTSWSSSGRWLLELLPVAERALGAVCGGWHCAQAHGVGEERSLQDWAGAMLGSGHGNSCGGCLAMVSLGRNEQRPRLGPRGLLLSQDSWRPTSHSGQRIIWATPTFVSLEPRRLQIVR